MGSPRAPNAAASTPGDEGRIVRALAESTDSGKAFAAAIEERGYILASGDRRDFCVVDHAGDAHSLARRLDGVKAKDMRERMADVDRDSLPSVTKARAQQREATRERPDASPTNEQPKDIFEAWRNKEATRQAEAAEPDATPEPKATAAPERDATPEQPKDIFEAWRNKEATRGESDNDAFWQGVNERREDRAEAVQDKWRKKRRRRFRASRIRRRPSARRFPWSMRRPALPKN